MNSLLKFKLKPPAFDSLPSDKVVINNATMLLTLKNSLKTLGFGSPDSLIAYVAGSATNFDTISTSYFGYGYRKDTTQTTNIVYTFNITSMVQQWINSPSSNFGTRPARGECDCECGPAHLLRLERFDVCSAASYHLYQKMI